MTRWLRLAAYFPTAGRRQTRAGSPAVAGGGGKRAAVNDTVSRPRVATPPVSQPTVMRVVLGPKMHTTLVATLQFADLVNFLANARPNRAFAPGNTAFDTRPAVIR